MVIGNGMIANSFKSYAGSDQFLIFASGVSNSKEETVNNFDREFTLLKQITADNADKTLVYFSTCSIFDNELALSPYIIHKKKIEEFIREKISSYVIFRVSNLAGTSNNPYTLLNYFIFNILNNHKITIWKNAHRNIIGIDDMFSIADSVLKDKAKANTIVNIANSKNYPVRFIVEEIEKHLNKKALITSINKGNNYAIDISLIIPIITQQQIIFNEDYLHKLLKQYYHSK